MPSRGITFSSLVGDSHSFLVSPTTKVDDLERLIRSDFMLCPEAELKIFDQCNNRISLDQLVTMTTTDPEYTDSFVITVDRTQPYYLGCDAHSVLLRGNHKSSTTLFNPMLPTDPVLPVAVMHVNLPMQIQLRQMPMPSTDRTYFLLELKVNAEFGISSPFPSHEVKNPWNCSSFKLKIRAQPGGPTATLRPYSHNPRNETPGMATTERSGLDHLLHHAKESVVKRSGPFNCTYNPYAYHTFVEEPVDAEIQPNNRDEDKTAPKEVDKERSFIWPGKHKTLLKTHAESGFVEWVVEYEKAHKTSMMVIEKPFVQTFQLECAATEKQPLCYTFDIIGELTAHHIDAPGPDDVFYVVQNERPSNNPGLKRIAAVQHHKIGVDVYQQAMHLACYKLGEVQPVFPTECVIPPKTTSRRPQTTISLPRSHRGSRDMPAANAPPAVNTNHVRQQPRSQLFMDSESPQDLRRTAAVRFQDPLMNRGTNSDARPNGNTATADSRDLNASVLDMNARPGNATVDASAGAIPIQEVITADNGGSSANAGLSRATGSGRA